MKGSIVSIIEVMLTGIILVLALYHFFPQYVIRSKWDRVLLSMKVMDTLKTIDDLDKTNEFALNTTSFTNFMGGVLKPEYHGAMVWWKETKGLGDYTEDMDIPYFTQGYKESIVDVWINRSEYSVDPHTVALWHLNENSPNTAYDETPNNNDGTWQDDTDYTDDCMFGYCLIFDGDKDYVSVPDLGVDSSLDIEDNITIEAWIKPRSIPIALSAIVVKNGAYVLGLNSAGEIFGIIYDGGFNYCPSQTSVQPDEWVHVAMSYSSSTGNVTIFYDGDIDEICDKSPANIAKNNNDLYIGIWLPFAGTSYEFDGTIDEVRISNTTRTSFESIGQYDTYSFTLGLGYPY